MDLEQIGKTVREHRLAKALSQADIATSVRISRSALSQLENGKVTEIGIRKVMEVLARLGLELTVREAHARPTLRELTEESRQLSASASAVGTRKRAPRKSGKPAVNGPEA